MAPPKNPLSSAPASHPYTTLSSTQMVTVSYGPSTRLNAIGFSVFLSILSTLIIHGGFSYVTFGSWLPDPYFRLRVDLMHRAKHGSDSDSYTQKGEFDEAKFDALFNHYSSTPHTSLSFNEGLCMVLGNRNPFDMFGWFAALFEWGSTYLLLWPTDGRMKKRDIRGILDGSLFYEMEKENRMKNTGKAA